MHMTHAMKVIESEGWSIEQEKEKEKENEYRVGKFSPPRQDFSIVMRGDTDADFAESIYAAYEALPKPMHGSTRKDTAKTLRRTTCSKSSPT